jgi:hypothetical protein
MSQYLPYKETIHELRKYLTREEEHVLWWHLSYHSYCFEPSVQAQACYWPDVQRLVPSTRQLYVESLQPLKISRIKDEPERDPVRPNNRLYSGGDQPKRKRRSTQRDRALAVLRELYPPDGMPPDHVSNSEIVHEVGKALKAKALEVPGRKTILRAAGRDPT